MVGAVVGLGGGLLLVLRVLVVSLMKGGASSTMGVWGEDGGGACTKLQS